MNFTHLKTVNKFVFILLIPFLFFSCQNKEHTQAAALLQQARSLHASGHFAEAKNAVDSISKVDSKAFPQIKAGLALLDSIRYGENIQIITQSESLLKEAEAGLEQQKRLFSYQINPAYQDQGDYFPKSCPQSLSGLGLYSGVKADGEMFLESVSDRSLKHNSVKVSASDGASVETAKVADDGANYRFQSGGKSVEVVHYSGKRENGAIAFIIVNRNKNLTVSLQGKSSASFTLSEQAKKGITDSYVLSHFFAQRDSLRFQIEKSKQLIKYLDSRKAKELTEKAKEQLK